MACWQWVMKAYCSFIRHSRISLPLVEEILSISFLAFSWRHAFSAQRAALFCNCNSGSRVKVFVSPRTPWSHASQFSAPIGHSMASPLCKCLARHAFAGMHIGREFERRCQCQKWLLYFSSPFSWHWGVIVREGSSGWAARKDFLCRRIVKEKVSFGLCSFQQILKKRDCLCELLAAGPCRP